LQLGVYMMAGQEGLMMSILQLGVYYRFDWFNNTKLVQKQPNDTSTQSTFNPAQNSLFFLLKKHTQNSWKHTKTYETKVKKDHEITSFA
jgi:hypothetical protein